MAPTTFGFSTRDWAAWSPGRESPALSTPQALRRRLSPLSQQAMNAAWRVMPQGTARIVFSSRHGEFSRTLALFKTLAAQEGVSPADFTLSVHHVLTGLLSIAQGNRAGHIAIASGEESFCYGFLEAAACLRERPEQPVLLIHCDEPLPAPYAMFDTPQAPLALALLLTADGTADYHFHTTPKPPASQPDAEPAQAFLRFLDSDAPALTCTGQRMQWQWVRHAAA